MTDVIHVVTSLKDILTISTTEITNQPSQTILSAIPRFCVEGLPKILDFVYFALIWWQTDKNSKS